MLNNDRVIHSNSLAQGTYPPPMGNVLVTAKVFCVVMREATDSPPSLVLKLYCSTAPCSNVQAMRQAYLLDGAEPS